MITASPATAQYPAAETLLAGRRPAAARWQQLWRESITDPEELLRLLRLSHLASTLLPSVKSGFAMRVPRGFAARMRAGDPHDPLLLQVLTQAVELADVPGFIADAVGDSAARSAPGVLQKYAGRALLIATGSCAVNCRYCFRRHFPYASETAASNEWHAALDQIRADVSISEVILSGGDPLSLATAKLSDLTDALAKIPHVRRLRIHTRLPIVLAERVDEELEAWLGSLPWPVALVLHVNHAAEIGAAEEAACARLARLGLTLLNQSVLLRSVNDDADTLCSLSERLFECGVLPYYLHQLDPVAGTAHFAVSDVVARQLVETMRRRLPGYLVPKLVREVPGEPSKVAL